MLVGSAGRATGRVDGPAGAIGGFGVNTGFGEPLAGGAAVSLGAALGFGEAGRAAARGVDELARLGVARFTAERLASSFPARVVVEDRRMVVRLEPADFAFVRLAVDRFARVFPARLAVIRFADEVGFLALDFFAVDFFAVDRFAVGFLVADFFLAGISPPSDDAMSTQ